MTTGRSNSKSNFRWLTASESADFARVSLNTLAAWVQKKRLHPRQELRKLKNGQTRSVAVFSEEELINKFRRRGELATAGEVAARAFEEFDLGTPVRTMVVLLRLTPHEIEELHEQWLSCGASELVITPAAQSEFERLLGPFDQQPSVADILDRVASLVGRVAASSDSTSASSGSASASSDSTSASSGSASASSDSTSTSETGDSASSPANPGSASP